MVTAWLDASVHRYESSYTLKAVFETLATLAVAAAAAGVIAGIAAFAMIGPLIYGGVLCARALFDTGMAIYYGITRRNHIDPEKKAECKAQVVDHALGAVTGAIFGALIVAASLIASPAALGAIAIVSCCAAAVAVFFAFFRPGVLDRIRQNGIKDSQMRDDANSRMEYTKGTNARLGRNMGTAEQLVLPDDITASASTASPHQSEREFQQSLAVENRCSP
jgi:hypothetical protein